VRLQTAQNRTSESVIMVGSSWLLDWSRVSSFFWLAKIRQTVCEVNASKAKVGVDSSYPAQANGYVLAFAFNASTSFQTPTDTRGASPTLFLNRKSSSRCHSQRNVTIHSLSTVNSTKFCTRGSRFEPTTS